MLKAGFGTKGPLIKDLRLKFFFKISPHPLKNIEIQKYYKNETRFDRAY